MSQQRRDALSTLTEVNSPFVPTKTQQIFHNSANLQLRGNTYDATHMDKFLSSGFGEKGVGITGVNNYSTFTANLHKSLFNPQPSVQQGSPQNNPEQVMQNATADSLYEH